VTAQLTQWGSRASALYTKEYAHRYRAQDEAVAHGDVVIRLGEWLRQICERFDRPIDVLDLGCGTGRYFHSLAGVRSLIGIDVSGPMLDHARRPVGSLSVPAEAVTLVEGDFLAHEFGAEQFDLVYSIGVLAEHAPFDEAVAKRVARWLRKGGRFALTTVDPMSFSVPPTLKRRVAEWLLPLSAAAPAWRHWLRSNLMRNGLYADAERVREIFLAAGLAVESIEPFTSDVHLHVLAVARKPS
jgi:SAM-dependent methyltransferase